MRNRPSIPNLERQRLEYINTINRYWADRGQFTRYLVRSTLFDAPDKELVAQRLDELLVDYTNLFAQLYGQEISESLRIGGLKFADAVAALTEAYKNNDVQAIELQRSNMYDAIDEVAGAYSQLTRYIDETMFQLLLYEYGNTLETYIASLVAGDYEESFKAYVEMTDIGYSISRNITDALIAQLIS